MIDHEFISARFADNEKTIIESSWIDKDGVTAIEVIEAKEGDWMFDQLLTVTTIDLIHENTVKFIRESREAFEDLVKDIAEKDGLTFKDLAQDEAFDLVIDTITQETDSESMFKFKLKMFDAPAVKNCKDRTLKADIRKAKTIAEVIAAFSKI